MTPTTMTAAERQRINDELALANTRRTDALEEVAKQDAVIRDLTAQLEQEAQPEFPLSPFDEKEGPAFVEA
jgi:hypothetical protein